MSSRKSHKSALASLAQTKAVEIIKECYEKKFSQHAKNMADWLQTSAMNVSRWLGGNRIPAWAILQILERWEDIREHFLVDAQTPIGVVDPDKQELINRIAVLLQDEIMFDHINSEVKFCEYARSEIKAYRQKSEESSVVHDPEDDL